MNKTETLRQSAAASNETRVAHLATQLESLRQAKHQSVESLAEVLEPLAQAMAALTDETRQTLAEIERQSREQAATFERQMAHAVHSCQTATTAAQEAAHSLSQAGQRMEWRHYLLAGMTGVATAALVSGFWLWLAPPPPIQNTLNAQAVAEYLKPAVIEALKPSRGK
jgi:polyhydroxyalkanoate synthesis regulator phasin